ncbi:MAG: hypothetical protein EOP11_00575 [Proteobacteria bacterium]|nr:MAG: hypothetical protein EOP11_00575 [Pseudomonadota bacterium]
MTKPRRLKDERGQAAIFMALFITTMIMLFAFTTNIGMLVHAKINLQNAADAAAYAGAAVQARQLTNAAYLNWEMRRAVKEFLYYYTIRSQYAAMPCFPTDASGRGSITGCQYENPESRHQFRFEDPRENNNEAGGPYLPSVCIIFDPNNNYCQKNGVPGIPEFPAGGSWGVADPIVAAVRSATADIILKKTADCEGRTDINRKFMIAWLFNLMPTSYELMTGKDSADPFPYVDGLERLGILPRMALLRARLDNIEEALNMNLVNENMGTITETTMGEFRGLTPKGGAKTLEYFERPIQAYLSAKNNLPQVNGENGNFSDIELTELLPSSGVAVELNPNLKNPPILAKFNDLTARTSFANSKFNERKGFGDRGNCYQVRELRTIPRFPFGVAKDPAVQTYYAVRLQARARLLFSPFGSDGTVGLSAYAAAKPFGSRIGKNLDPDRTEISAREMMVAPAKLGFQFSDKGDYADASQELFTSLSPTFPNVLVADNDSRSDARGFTAQGHLGYIRGATISLNRLDLGPRLAGAYAPWEVGYYTPPASYPQAVAGAVAGLFEDNPLYGTKEQEGKFFALQAGIFPVNGDGAGDLGFIRTKVGGYLAGSILDEETIKKGPFMQFLEGNKTDPDSGVLTDIKFEVLQQYLKASRQIYLHFIPDPMLSDEPQLQAYARAVGQKYTVAGMPQAYKRQLTSWNNEKTSANAGDASFNIPENSELGPNTGRSGYSVRFVSFAALKAGGLGSNDPRDQKSWTNPLERFTIPDPDVSKRVTDDINKIKH